MAQTTQKDGSWSDTAVWAGGVLPADSETVAVNHNITYDYDNSAMTNGYGAVTIATGKALTASSAAGNYYLKLKASTGGAGALKAGTSLGVPYPAGSVFTIHLNGNYANATSLINLFCLEPTYRRVALTATANVGATTLDVDTDLTGDIWAAGNLVNIVDIAAPYPDSEQRTIAVGGISSTQITITSGLTNSKAAGSYIYLISRNVKIIGNDYSNGLAVVNSSGIVYAEIRSLGYCHGFGSSAPVIFGGTIDVGYGFNGLNGQIHSVMCGSGAAANFPFLGNAFNYTIHSDCIITGWIYGFRGGGLVFNGTEILCTATTGIDNGGYGLWNYKFLGCNLHHNGKDFSGGIFKAYNTTFGSTIEFYGYNSAQRNSSLEYSESYNHDNISGAFRAWTRGGITSSTTSNPPTGRVRCYNHVCESATYPCWHQREILVEAGRTLRVRVWLKGDVGVEIKSQLVLPTADPLITGTGTGEWQQIGTSDTAWHEYVTSWTNSATYPVTIYLRFLATAASGNGYSDFQWAFDRTPLVR